jgi:uncharacterized protein YutE (UPF0331/DUF86 family)
MSPDKISQRIVSYRIDWIERMLREVRLLPLDDYREFLADRRNVWSAESCLRRALEGLMDLGRHILAKGFARAVSEYKEIAYGLREFGVLNPEEAETFRILAGYRNRMVHFYHEISWEELYSICSEQLEDVESLVDSIKQWLKTHPNMMDDSI